MVEIVDKAAAVFAMRGLEIWGIQYIIGYFALPRLDGIKAIILNGIEPMGKRFSLL